jgi:hypothetical protein
MVAVLEGPLRPGDRVAVVDDSPDDAARTAEMVLDAEFVPVTIELSYGDIESLLDAVGRKARALICDHRLSHHASVPYNGAQVVAASNLRGIPAVLISGFIDMDEHSSIRRYRADIPCLLDKRFEPEQLADALNAAHAEATHGPALGRRAFRTVVRVVSIQKADVEPIAEVIVTAWNPKEVVALPANLIAEDTGIDLESLAGHRFMAEVNIYASSHEELFFRKFEIAEPPPADWLPQ